MASETPAPQSPMSARGASCMPASGEVPVIGSAPASSGSSMPGDRDVVVEDPRGEDGVVRCWEVRGCAGLYGFSGFMQDECPHNEEDRYMPCPATCAFTRCQRPWHKDAVTLEDLTDPYVDRMATIKEQCRHCLHFIKNGPRASAR